MLQVMTITIAQKEEASVWNQLWENQPIPVASPITGNSSVIINLHRNHRTTPPTMRGI